MSANSYCSIGKDQPWNATDFGELCTAAKVRIVIQILFLPVIATGSVLITTTILLLRKEGTKQQQFNTLYHHILLSVAALDFVTSAILSPINILNVFPETQRLVKSSQGFCAFVYYNIVFTNLLAFDLLTMLCVDRCLTVWRPDCSCWYRTGYVAKRSIVDFNAFVVLVRGSTVVIAVLVQFTVKDGAPGSEDDYWTSDRCSDWDELFPHGLLLFLFMTLLAEFVLSYGLCAKVALIAYRSFKHTRSDSSGEEAKNAFIQIKEEVTLTLCLMAVVLLLWLPLLVPWAASTNIRDDQVRPTAFLSDVAEMTFLAYCGSHLPLFAVANKDFRNSFIFLLTSWPWNWMELRRWHDLHDKGHSDSSIWETIRQERSGEKRDKNTSISENKAKESKTSASSAAAEEEENRDQKESSNVSTEPIGGGQMMVAATATSNWTLFKEAIGLSQPSKISLSAQQTPSGTELEDINTRPAAVLENIIHRSYSLLSIRSRTPSLDPSDLSSQVEYGDDRASSVDMNELRSTRSFTTRPVLSFSVREDTHLDYDYSRDIYHDKPNHTLTK